MHTQQRAVSPNQRSHLIVREIFGSRLSPSPTLIQRGLLHTQTNSTKPASTPTVLPLSVSPADRASYYLSFLDHAKYEVALTALEELRRIIPQCTSGLQIVQRMVQVLEHYPQLRVSFIHLLVDTVSLFGGDATAALPVIAKILLDKSTEHSFIQRAAIRCLIKIGCEGIRFLVHVATDSGCGSLQELILDTLAAQPEVQEWTVLPMLHRELLQSCDTRASAVMAVSRLFDKAVPLGSVSRGILAEAVGNCGEEGEEVLLRMLNHTNFRLRACAAVALGRPRLADPVYLNVKIRLYEKRMMSAPPSSPTYLSDGDHITGIQWDGREFAGMVDAALQEGLLHRIDPVDLPEPNSPKLNKDNLSLLPMREQVTAVKIAAASSLANSSYYRGSSPILQGALQQALGDRMPGVREQIAKTIGVLGPSIASHHMVSALAVLLRDEFYQVRHASCITLGKLRECALPALPELLHALQHNTVNRLEAATSIASLGSEAQIELLRIIMTSSLHNVNTRIAATTGLSTIKLDELSSQRVEATVACLYSAAKDSSPLLRVAAVHAIGKFGSLYTNSVLHLHPSRVLPFLYGMLGDRDSTVRVEAAEQIAGLWKEGGELLLVEGLLKDSSPLIRAASARGLTATGPRSTRSLLMALADEDGHVREAAAQALLSFGLDRILDDLTQQPRHYLESIIHFCDGILQSEFHGSHSPPVRSGNKSARSGARRPNTPTRSTHDKLARTHDPAHDSARGLRERTARTQDLRGFVESLRTHVIAMASLRVGSY